MPPVLVIANLSKAQPSPACQPCVPSFVAAPAPPAAVPVPVVAAPAVAAKFAPAPLVRQSAGDTPHLLSEWFNLADAL